METRAREIWDVKSFICVKLNKRIFEGVGAFIQFPLNGLFTHKDLTWYLNFRLGESKVKCDIEVTYILSNRM